MENTPKSKGKGGVVNTIFKIGVVILMLAIVALLLLQYFDKDDDSAGDSSTNSMEASVRAKLGQLENKTDAEIQEELNRVIEEGMFHIAINNDPVFQTGESEGNLRIENVPGNQYTMRVEIVLDETGEIVYDSGLVDPNYHIQTDVLNTVLEAGDYPASALFYAYDLDTLAEMGSAAANITLHILE